MATTTEYLPLYVTPPGHTLRDELDARGMSQTELAARLGMAKQTISKIMGGEAPISEETAIGLERVLGVPAYFWSAREADYRTYIEHEQQRELLAGEVEWVRRFPYREMAGYGWVAETRKPLERLLSLLSFLGIKTPAEWPRLMTQRKYAAFRSSVSASASEYSLGAWLIQGERVAQQQSVDEYSPATLRGALQEMRALTVRAPEEAREGLLSICAAAGLRLALVPSLPRLGVWGATRWLSATRPMIQLSNRYRTDDQFWFTFFHEAFHVLLHRNKTIFESAGIGSSENAVEAEADEAACGLLMPDSAYWPFVERREPRTAARVQELAHKLGIAPGIVVGRLQREKWVRYDNKLLNELKRDFSAIFLTTA